MKRILVSGVSGPIGTALVPSLRAQGSQVIRLVRDLAQAPDQISWDLKQPLSPASVSGFDAVIHLAGESVFGRWTAAKKKEILDSRILGTSNLATAIAKAERKPNVFLCASAVGFYGNRGNEVLTEESSRGNDFPAEICRAWEDASRSAADARIRTANLRIGLVLSPKGGALARMLPVFRLGLGGKIGSGKQWSSWIHVNDIVGAIHHILDHESFSGPINMVGPDPVTNEEFTRTLAAVLHRPAILPVPGFALRLVFGEMADQLLLAGQRVEPAKLLSSGYRFRFADLHAALEDLLG
jgi:uncharacterized protein